MNLQMQPIWLPLKNSSLEDTICTNRTWSWQEKQVTQHLFSFRLTFINKLLLLY